MIILKWKPGIHSYFHLVSRMSLERAVGSNKKHSLNLWQVGKANRFLLWGQWATVCLGNLHVSVSIVSYNALVRKVRRVVSHCKSIHHDACTS